VAMAEADPARVLGVTVPSGYGPTIAAAGAQNPLTMSDDQIRQQLGL